MADVNNKKLWFRAKRYGYGWTPVTWQGWSVVLLYILAIMQDLFYMDNATKNDPDVLLHFLPRFIILTIFLIIICTAKGEPARWSWGKRDEIDRN